jgi:hypothetical protein
MKLLYSLLLTLIAFSASSQTSSNKPSFRAGQPVTLSWAQLTRTVHRTDSLTAVGVAAKKQATRWQFSALAYRGSADSLRTALVAKGQEVDRTRDKVVDLNRLLVSQTARTDKYKARAHRKGWLNAMLAAVIGGLVYVQLTR